MPGQVDPAVPPGLTLARPLFAYSHMLTLFTEGLSVSPTRVRDLFGSPSEVHSHTAVYRNSTTCGSLENGKSMLLFFVIGFMDVIIRLL